MSPIAIHPSVITQVSETQVMMMRCTQRRDLPFGVSVSEEIEALVMEAGESASEKTTWMGNRMGNVVKVCKRANHPVERSGISATKNATIELHMTHSILEGIERRGWRQSPSALAFSLPEK